MATAECLDIINHDNTSLKSKRPSNTQHATITPQIYVWHSSRVCIPSLLFPAERAHTEHTIL